MPMPVDEFMLYTQKHFNKLRDVKHQEYLRDLAEIEEALDTTECPDPLPTASTGHDQLSEDNDC